MTQWSRIKVAACDECPWAHPLDLNRQQVSHQHPSATMSGNGWDRLAAASWKTKHPDENRKHPRGQNYRPWRRPCDVDRLDRDGGGPAGETWIWDRENEHLTPPNRDECRRQNTSVLAPKHTITAAT